MLEVQERLARYLNRRYSDRSTPKHYLNDVELFIRHLGSRAPQNVTTKDIDDFVDAQLEKQLKPVTINRRLASLHTFFEYLASEAPDLAWPNPVNQWRHTPKATVIKVKRFGQSFWDSSRNCPAS